MSEIDTINENGQVFKFCPVDLRAIYYAFIIIIGTGWMKPNKS